MTATASLSIDRLRHDGQAFMEELTREFYLSTAGHKLTAELQPIYARYAHILSADALGMMVDLFRDTRPDSEEQRQARILLEWQADSMVGRELAELDERELAWEGSAMLTLADGSGMQFER